jgi:hypothetical protein
MNVADLERHLLNVAQQVPRLKVAEDADERALFSTAEKLLQDEHTTATGCFRAAQVLCGDGFRAWEPESLWLTLDRKGVEVPLLNRDKLLAASTLTIVPAFWWEVSAFENTTMAFNNVLSDSRVLQEATPAQLSWAVYEAELLYGQQDDLEDTPSFDREPVIYAAVVLNRCGFVLAPTLLDFAQRELDKLNQDGAEVSKDTLEDAWSKLKKQDLRKREFTDSALDTQLSRLTATQLYVSDRAAKYEDDLGRLR